MPGPGRDLARVGLWLVAGTLAYNVIEAGVALAGWEAAIQQATLPDRTVRFRVRLGPYDSVDEMNRVRSDLARRGFEVSAIR